MMMTMPAIPVPFFVKHKAKPLLSLPRRIVTVKEEDGNMYRKLTVADLAVDYRTSYVCDGTGALIGQVRNVLTGKNAVLRQGEVYYLMPKSFRLPSSTFSFGWNHPSNFKQSANIKLSEAKRKCELVSHQSLVWLRLVSPRLPVAFVVDDTSIKLRSRLKGSAPISGCAVKTGLETRSPMNRSKQWLPALETITESELMSTKHFDNVSERDEKRLA